MTIPAWNIYPESAAYSTVSPGCTTIRTGQPRTGPVARFADWLYNRMDRACERSGHWRGCWFLNRCPGVSPVFFWAAFNGKDADIQVRHIVHGDTEAEE